MNSCDSNIGINNGPNAGQLLPHVHIHIIPRPNARAQEYYREIREKIKDRIEEVIEELKKINEEGFYSNTIKALEKIKLEFLESEKPPDIIGNDENEDAK